MGGLGGTTAEPTLPPELAAMLGEGETPAGGEDIAALIAGMEGGPEGGLGRGPYPEGAAPQTVQGGRGLTTENTQPTPSAPSVDLGNLGVIPQGEG